MFFEGRGGGDHESNLSQKSPEPNINKHFVLKLTSFNSWQLQINLWVITK